MLICFNLLAQSAAAQATNSDLKGRLFAVRDEMKLVADSLNTELPDGTTLGSQQRITDELRMLVGQFAAGQQSNDQDAVPQQTPGATQSGTTQGSGMAAADSSEDTAESQASNGEVDNARLILKAWGLMPGEQSGERGGGISPRFLPGYERLIREYYRRMSK